MILQSTLDSVPQYSPLAGLVAILAGIVIATVVVQRRPHYPPGPTGLPLLKNLWDIPRNNPWAVYRDWGLKHSEPFSDSALTNVTD